MGKVSKGSRKGKKAWRANISTDDVEDFFEKSTKDALAGAKEIPDLPSQSLFYVDKSKPSKDIPIRRKIEKHREKVLHYESVLQRNPYVKPVPSSTTSKKKNKTKAKEVPKETVKSDEDPKEVDPAAVDLNIWDEQAQTNGRTKKRSAPTPIPAVEVEPPGCSFNPSFEAHQDSLAEAVANEMTKVYQKELEPEPVPLTVDGEILDEEEKLFLDADDGNEDISEENVEQNDGERRVHTKRVTRVEQNRRARRKQQVRAEEEAKKLESFNKEIDSLPEIMEEIAKEDEEKQKRHLRRVVAKQERLKSAPPRLGKHKFEPAPVQVLLTEEISGSLRKLKGCCTLVRDRYKSYEKRGILVPRAKRARR